MSRATSLKQQIRAGLGGLLAWWGSPSVRETCTDTVGWLGTLHVVCPTRLWQYRELVVLQAPFSGERANGIIDLIAQNAMVGSEYATYVTPSRATSFCRPSRSQSHCMAKARQAAAYWQLPEHCATVSASMN